MEDEIAKRVKEIEERLKQLPDEVWEFKEHKKDHGTYYAVDPVADMWETPHETANANFIAHSKGDVEWLLSELKRVDGELKEIQEMVTRRKVWDADCHRCAKEAMKEATGFTATRMILCPECGNKRCPKASDHDLKCTESNESGQPGSMYTKI